MEMYNLDLNKYYKHLIIENNGYPIYVRDKNNILEFSVVHEGLEKKFEYPDGTVVIDTLMSPPLPDQVGALSQGVYTGRILPHMTIIESLPALIDWDSIDKDYDKLPKHIKLHRKLKFFISQLAYLPERQESFSILQQLVDGQINAANFRNRINQMHPYFDVNEKTIEFVDDALPSLRPFLESGELQLNEMNE